MADDAFDGERLADRDLELALAGILADLVSHTSAGLIAA